MCKYFQYERRQRGFRNLFIFGCDWLKQDLHGHGHRVLLCFGFSILPRSLFHWTEWITQTLCKPSAHTVAAQSFLTSSLFSHSIIHCLFIHCSSHSLLPPPSPPPPSHCVAWRGGFIPRWQIQWWHWYRWSNAFSQESPSLFLFSWLSKKKKILSSDSRCQRAGVGTNKEKRKHQSSLLQSFIDKDKIMAAPWHTCLWLVCVLLINAFWYIDKRM